MNDLEPQSPRRCTATNRAGEQCRRAPILGGTVCVMHGGGIPAVKQAAKERLLAMVEPALDVLYRAVRQSPPCAVCGRSDADRDPTAVRAAGMILDRTGFHPTLQVQTVEPPNPFSTLTLAEIADRAEVIARQARAMADAEAERTIDAVLVEGEPEPGEGQG